MLMMQNWIALSYSAMLGHHVQCRVTITTASLQAQCKTTKCCCNIQGGLGVVSIPNVVIADHWCWCKLGFRTRLGYAE